MFERAEEKISIWIIQISLRLIYVNVCTYTQQINFEIIFVYLPPKIFSLPWWYEDEYNDDDIMKGGDE